MMRKWRFFYSLLLIGGMIAVGAPVDSLKAEPNEVVSWLMNKPLTLWDRGMITVEENADRATSRIAKETAHTITDVSYDWNYNEINVSLYMVDYKGDLSLQKCNEWRNHLIERMFDIWFQMRIKRDADMRRTLLFVRISELFSHKGFQEKDRDKNLGKKLAQIIFVQTMLRNGADAIACRAPVTVSDAPQHPLIEGDFQ